MQHFNRGIQSEMKADNTPVTEADKECERLIRDALAERFPNDSILGEEGGAQSGGNGKRVWIIDPIDGTYNYARKVPIFSILLALQEDGQIVLGVVHAPAMNETYCAEKGNGAYRNGERIRVSSICDISQAQFNFGAVSRIFAKGLALGFERIVRSTYRQRGYGDYLSFAYVFDGRAEASLEVDVHAWDLAPMKIIVEEAGGKYTDLQGGDSIDSGSCLISNGILHQELLSLLAVK